MVVEVRGWPSGVAVINYLVMFDIIFRPVPVSAVNGKVAQRGTDIDLDAAAELALMDIPFFVEPAPVVMGCAGGLKLAQIAAARREKTGPIQVFLRGQRFGVFCFPSDCRIREGGDQQAS